MVMKKILLSVLGLVAYQGIAQQSFTGLRTSTYGGVLTTLSNPAHALGARPWDATLLSIDANLNSNAIGLNWDLEGSFNKFTKDLAAGEATSVNAGINADVVGPSFIVRINKENAVGLVSRMRLMAGTTGIDANLLNALINGKKMDIDGFRNLEGISDMNLLANAFREIGAVWSYTAMNDGYNLLRVGVGVKLVQGTGSFRMGFEGVNANNFSLGKDSDGDMVLRVGNAKAEVRSGGLDVLNGSPDFFGTAATTVGVDLGVIYEYSEDGCPNCDGHVPYRFKVGVSLLDLGRLSYETNRNSYAYNLVNKSIKLNDIEKALKEADLRPKELGGTTFKSSLPTTLNVNLDYRFVDGVYLNFSSQLNMVPKNEYNAYYGNDFVLTPRYETHWGGGVFGAYLPISYNSVSSLNAGVALQVGPLVLGSRSVFGNLIGTAKELNAFVGLRFGNIYQ